MGKPNKEEEDKEDKKGQTKSRKINNIRGRRKKKTQIGREYQGKEGGGEKSIKKSALYRGKRGKRRRRKQKLL